MKVLGPKYIWGPFSPLKLKANCGFPWYEYPTSTGVKTSHLMWDFHQNISGWSKIVQPHRIHVWYNYLNLEYQCYQKHQPNAAIYTIHGSYGNIYSLTLNWPCLGFFPNSTVQTLLISLKDNTVFPLFWIAPNLTKWLHSHDLIFLRNWCTKTAPSCWALTLLHAPLCPTRVDEQSWITNHYS